MSDNPTRRDVLKAGGAAATTPLIGSTGDDGGLYGILDGLFGSDNIPEDARVAVGEKDERTEVNSHDIDFYFALDGTVFEPDGNAEWEKVQSSGPNPTFEDVEADTVGAKSGDFESVGTDRASTAEQPTGKDGSYVEQRGGITATVSPSITHYPQYSRPQLRAGYQKGSTVYAFEQGSSGDIYKSTDKGATYSKQGSIGKAVDYIHRIESTGTLVVWASDATVHRSTDDGSTWTQVLTASYTPLSQQAITETPSGYLLFGEYGSSTTDTFNIYQSTDDAQTFDNVYSTDSSRGTTQNPGHVHNLQYDPVEGALVALLDYPDIRVIKSTNEGTSGSWTVVADETDPKHPNFVSLMFFDDWVVWGYDSHGMNGWVRKMKRTPFYSGDWSTSNIFDVGKLNDKMSYGSYPIGNDAWLLAQANESNEHPGVYGQELHVVYHDGQDVRLSNGLSFSDVVPADAMATNGNIPWFCGYEYDVWTTDSSHETYRGTTVANINVNVPQDYAAVPITVGEDANQTVATDAPISDMVLPPTANMRARSRSGNLYPILGYTGNNETALKNGAASNNPILKINDADKMLFQSSGTVWMAVKPNFETQFNVPLDVTAGGPNGTGELGFSNTRIYEDANGEVVAEDSAGNTTTIS